MSDKYGGAARIGLHTTNSANPPDWIIGGIRNASTLDLNWIRDEETTGDAHGGGTAVATIQFRSQESYGSLKTIMENETPQYVYVDYGDDDVETSVVPVKILVKKQMFLDGNAGKRGIEVSFRRIHKTQIF